MGLFSGVLCVLGIAGVCGKEYVIGKREDRRMAAWEQTVKSDREELSANHQASREQSHNALELARSEVFQSRTGRELTSLTLPYNQIRLRIIKEAGVNPTLFMVALGVLAQDGLIHIDVAEGGILPTWQKDRYGNTLPARTTELKFLKWYDKELRAHGVRRWLFFVPMMDRNWCESHNNLGRGRRVADMEPTKELGRYVWIPAQLGTFAGDGKALLP